MSATVTAAAARPSAAGGYRHPAPSVTLVHDGLADVAPRGAPSLAACYEICRRLNAAHGRTYYLAARLLPAERRRHVHALYAFARYADDLVDHQALGWDGAQRRAAFEAWSGAALAAIARGAGPTPRTDGEGERRYAAPPTDPVLAAAAHTVAVLGIGEADLRAFLTSMAMDLTVTRYATYADLARYMHGSAAAIGAMMVPVLGAPPEARAPAMDLGVAFQLSNFLRDVGEDWDRGRIYLPLEDLDRFGVGEWDFRARHVGPAFRRLLAFEAARARALYRSAERGWPLLPPASRRCVRVAHRLYAGILDALEAEDYQVFRVRAAVPRARRAAVAVRELVRRTWAGDPAVRVGHNGRRLAEVPPWSGGDPAVNAQDRGGAARRMPLRFGKPSEESEKRAAV